MQKDKRFVKMLSINGLELEEKPARSGLGTKGPAGKDKNKPQLRLPSGRVIEAMMIVTYLTIMSTRLEAFVNVPFNEYLD